MAGERPDLFQGLVVHEPPLFALLFDDPVLAPILQGVDQKIRAVVERIASGDHAGAAEQLIETVALGPGRWSELSEEGRQALIENAPTFLDEASDPEQLAFDLEWIRGFSKPALLTRGNESPPTFAPVIAKVAEALPRADVVTIPGAGTFHMRRIPTPVSRLLSLSFSISNLIRPTGSYPVSEGCFM